jgi:DNA-binding response OmpR family regulator
MRSISVYIAEHDTALRTSLASALTRHGFDIHFFDSGYPIVSMMDNWPDVFLIEIQLPGINGLEVCKWLKSHENSCHIPVILLSSDPYLKILAASTHADDYIETPVDARHLLDHIHECLMTQRVL